MPIFSCELPFLVSSLGSCIPSCNSKLSAIFFYYVSLTFFIFFTAVALFHGIHGEIPHTNCVYCIENFSEQLGLQRKLVREKILYQSNEDTILNISVLRSSSPFLSLRISSLATLLYPKLSLATLFPLPNCPLYYICCWIIYLLVSELFPF